MFTQPGFYSAVIDDKEVFLHVFVRESKKYVLRDFLVETSYQEFCSSIAYSEIQSVQKLYKRPKVHKSSMHLEYMTEDKRIHTVTISDMWRLKKLLEDYPELAVSLNYKPIKKYDNRVKKTKG